ncbi:glycoside hydrolase family 2 protein [Wolfiporia cocos MD-104 SS10]|uniref:Beta-mannosidase A n=1 Tax=Wolfiporia cocos (strain MD-104) TaxID=742152 RepID=A0A2H3J2A7_WOLCO|nr:glycoside hydrolase family 2 protein [Wolfiporia cocos MD-104 SS10]
MLRSSLRALLAACLPALALANVYSLSDLQWTLRNGNGSIVIPASVPSQAHIDLYRAGIIENPLLGINGFWTYTADTTPFTEAVGTNPFSRTLLVFYGLDTIANITVAGHPVAWVDNQFQQYTYDVTDLIASPANGDNNITVAFESAYFYGLNVTSLPDTEVPLTPDYAGFRQYLRKTQSDFGWDWGPAFVPAGIFRPAYLVTLSEYSLEISKVGQTYITAPDQTADWLVNVTLGVRSVLPSFNPSIVIDIPELGVYSGPLNVSSIPASTAEPTFVSASITVPNGVPQRWYPRDLGTPTLYNFTISLALGDIDGIYIDSTSFTLRSGFRTIELIQTPYPEEEIEARGITPGDQWHFQINGQPFYTKGTNIIPFDPFYARITSEKVRWVLESAVLSGQNMLRVWGGGIYQPSDALTGVYDFYSVCDELGILAWSEMIFSDATYPLNNFLLVSIDPEVRQNVRRINKHPSNVQWAGGNEIENIVIAINETYANGTHYLDEFVFMFQDFLHNITYEEQSSIPYTDCSTTNGVLSLDPYVLRFENKTPGYIYGNTERYNYDASQAFNYSTYPVSSFHSMPSFYTWEEVLQSPEDYAFNSTVVMSRDHHPPAGSLAWPNPNAPQGQGQMTMAVELWLPTPNTTDANQTFAQWCWSTQVFQSMNMVSEIAWYRRGAGLGENNLGALVWQLNDIWQGVSWASVEYSGRWKVLNYGMAQIYSPVIVYPFWTPDNQTLDIMVTSDRWYAVNGTAQLTWYDWAGTQLEAMTHEFTVPSLNNTVLMSMQGYDEILPSGATPTNSWMLLNVTADVNGRTVAMETYYTPTSLAYAELVDPEIALTTGENLTFTLSAKGGVAAYAWLDHPYGTVGYFVDDTTGNPLNGFYLVPGIDRTCQ